MVGLAIPDLWHTQLNLYAPKHEPNDSIEKHWFKTGLQKHFLADKIFHNSSYFLEMCDWANREIRKAKLSENVKRKFFLVHVGIEIAIDIVLIRLYPYLVEEFYKNFDEVCPEKIQKYMEQIYYYDFEGLSQKIVRFAAEKRIYDYLKPEKLVSLLDQIMQKITQSSPFSDQDKERMLCFMEVLDKKIASNYENLFEEMSKKMKT